jgi:hypothetical protein
MAMNDDLIMLLTCEHFDAIVCTHQGQGVGEGPLTLNPRCHIGSAVIVTYVDGIVSVACASCRTVVAHIPVVSHPAARALTRSLSSGN